MLAFIDYKILDEMLSEILVNKSLSVNKTVKNNEKEHDNDEEEDDKKGEEEEEEEGGESVNGMDLFELNEKISEMLTLVIIERSYLGLPTILSPLHHSKHLKYLNKNNRETKNKNKFL